MNYHANAKTNVYLRKLIKETKSTVKRLSDMYGLSHVTVRKWKRSQILTDKSCRPLNIEYALTLEEETIFLAYRKATYRGLDDTIDELSRRLGKDFFPLRSSIYRLYKRNGMNKRPKVEKEESGVFAKYDPGFIHIDVTEIPNVDTKKVQFLFVAIDRATRYMYYKAYDRQTSLNAADFIERCVEFFPFKLTHILTDRGREFTNAGIYNRDLKAYLTTDGQFTRKAKEYQIRHRLTKPYTPKTNGMVERANRKIKSATVYAETYSSNFQLEVALKEFLREYNHNKMHTGLIRELKVKTPQQAVNKLVA